MAQDATTLDEPKRLDVLRSYEILDTLPEQAFDRRVRLAAQICGVPYAAITFMDGAGSLLNRKSASPMRMRRVSLARRPITPISLSCQM